MAAVPIYHHIPLFHGVLFVAFLLVTMLADACLIWRGLLLRFLAVLSLVVAVCAVVSIPATWNHSLIVTFGGGYQRANGDVVHQQLDVTLNRDGACFSMYEYPTKSSGADAHPHPGITWSVGNNSLYPELNPDISLTRGARFVEEVIGIKVGLISRPNKDFLFGLVLIFPLWLPLLFCPWAPVFLWRRWVKRRHRVKNGLCLFCGFDLRAHASGQKCPECGRPVPARPATATVDIQPPAA